MTHAHSEEAACREFIAHYGELGKALLEFTDDWGGVREAWQWTEHYEGGFKSRREFAEVYAAKQVEDLRDVSVNYKRLAENLFRKGGEYLALPVRDRVHVFSWN